MTEPLPRRIAWFAPWTWKRRWKRLAIVMAIATPVLYVLAEAPMEYLIVRHHQRSFGTSWEWNTHCEIYQPMHRLRSCFPQLEVVDLALRRWIEDRLGPSIKPCGIE